MIHIIGDSHAARFEKIGGVIIHYVGPWTAHNLHRHDSQICAVVNKLPINSSFLFGFGEIDCRIHIFYQSKIKNILENVLVSNTVEQYLKYILKFNLPFGVLAVPPQGLQENIYSYQHYATREQRQQITNEFNLALEKACKLYNIGFINIWKYEKVTWPDEDFEVDKCHIKSDVIKLLAKGYL